MVSQFVSSHKVRLLADLDFHFPAGTHAIGRLDSHSEGLLLLTTNQKITRLLFQGKALHTRTYLVQANNLVTGESLQKLRAGISIRVKGGLHYTTKPCDAAIVEEPENLFSSGYVLRENVLNTWLRLSLTEGKFHQIRKMVGAIGHRCKRLIRISIADITLNDLQPGEVKEIGEKDFFEKLNLRLPASV